MTMERISILFSRNRLYHYQRTRTLTKYGFEVDLSELDKNRLTVKYEQPNPVRARVGDFAIIVGNKGPLFSEDRFRKVEIKQRAWVEISSDLEKPFDDYVTVLQYVRNFLSLALSHPIYPLIIEGYTDQNKMHTKDGSEFDIPIEIHYRVPFIEYDEEREFRGYNSLFMLSNIQDNFELYMTNWINKVELLYPVYTLYFSTLFNPHIYLEGQFLSLAQAIETYHRRRYDGKYQADEEYKVGLYQVLVGAIPNGLDESFKTSLITGKLKYANEFSLRTRLGKIIKKTFADLQIQFSLSQYQGGAFTNQVVDTRNYLTHYTEDLKTKAAHGKDLYELIRRLKALLELCLLEEIGFAASSMREIALANPKYRGLFESV